MKPQIIEGMDTRNDKYSEIDTNFQDFAENRSSGFWIQFKEIFKRNVQFMLRNKKALSAIFFNSFIISMMILAVYWQIAKWPDLSKNFLPPSMDPKVI